MVKKEQFGRHLHLGNVPSQPVSPEDQKHEVIAGLVLVAEKWARDPASAPQTARHIAEAYRARSFVQAIEGDRQVLRELQGLFSIVDEVGVCWPHETDAIERLTAQLRRDLTALTQRSPHRNRAVVRPAEPVRVQLFDVPSPPLTLDSLEAVDHVMDGIDVRPAKALAQYEPEHTEFEQPVGETSFAEVLEVELEGGPSDDEAQYRKRLAKRREKRTKARNAALPGELQIENIRDLKRALKLIDFIEVHPQDRQIAFTEAMYDALPQPGELSGEMRGLREPVATLRHLLDLTSNPRRGPLHIRRSGLKEAARAVSKTADAMSLRPGQSLTRANPGLGLR